MTRAIASWGVAVMLSVTAVAQEAKPKFEVASVRRSRSVPVLPTLSVRPGGLVMATAQPLTRIIAFGYGVDDFRLIGGPGWIRDARFDVEAKAAGDVPSEQTRLMMQSLLEERFKLVTRKEQREMTVYAVVLARADGRVGSGIQRIDDCKNAKFSGPPAGRYSGCGSISVVASIASMMLGAPVIDKTGLTGTFAVAMNFSPEGVRPFAGEAARDALPAERELPSFRDAMRDQLGFKLESTRGPVEVLVIDSVSQPTEN